MQMKFKRYLYCSIILTILILFVILSSPFFIWMTGANSLSSDNFFFLNFIKESHNPIGTIV